MAIETNQGTVSVPSDGKVIVALGTIGSTRLLLVSLPSLPDGASGRIGINLMAHLRSNLDVRIPREKLATLPATVQALQASAQALTSTKRERFVAQALSRLSAESAAQQRREAEELAGALFDEQQALQARQRLMDEGRSVTDRTRTATEQYAAEVGKLNERARGRRYRGRAPPSTGYASSRSAA
jgi:hypothetical protein